MTMSQDCPYKNMAPKELRAELERLDKICVGQELKIKQLTDGTLAMIKDFSVVILAHIDGDSLSVQAGLANIVSKNVVICPKPQEMH